jgi:hypothetical protein
MSILSNEERLALAELFRSTEVQLEAVRQSPEAERQFPERIAVEGAILEEYTVVVGGVGQGSPWEQLAAKLAKVTLQFPLKENLSDEQYRRKLAETFVLNHVFHNWQQYGFRLPPKEPRKRLPRQKDSDFWETAWGRRLLHPDTQNPKSRLGKLFRRRFRLPYPVFLDFVEKCKHYNIFDLKYDSSIPVECKVLACLRILGRDHSADDCNDACDAIGISTVRSTFHTFVENVSKRMFHLYVGFPTGDYLKEVMETYAKLGLPGCVGSFDCTHVKWSMCPAADRWYAVGKYYDRIINVYLFNSLNCCVVHAFL